MVIEGLRRVTCVAGARPNFMKIKPVIDALERIGIDTELVHTGQHYDESMSDVFFDDLGLRAPDVHLGTGSGGHAEQVARVMVAFERHLDEHPTSMVVVVGDVNSTLACALVAAKAGCLVAHVEAGLRSRDWAMPEEVNRLVADRLADLLFAPSPDAVENLVAEGYFDDQIHLVGNVMIDTLLVNAERARRRPVLAELGLEHQAYGLVTLHRPSNVDDPETLSGLVSALNRVGEQLPLVFPAHPRTIGHLESLPAAKRLGSRVRVVEPRGYLDFLALQAGARLVLTDSGGLQEETTALGVPCLTLRDNTERPITITQGTNRLVGVDPDTIVAAAMESLESPAEARCPDLWDGRAGDRIAEVIAGVLDGDGILRPTDLRTR